MLAIGFSCGVLCASARHLGHGGDEEEEASSGAGAGGAYQDQALTALTTGFIAAVLLRGRRDGSV